MQNAQQPAPQPAPMTKEWALGIFDLMHSKFQDTPEGHYHINRARLFFESAGEVAPVGYDAKDAGGTVFPFPAQTPKGAS